ncbi:MAG: DNA-binding transcriptional repressor YiaJ [Burkholderia plantarii]|nr:MAG: DNA-binding transcriptional repressor YiaJ [Burkholderia plantarii]
MQPETDDDADPAVRRCARTPFVRHGVSPLSDVSPVTRPGSLMTQIPNSVAPSAGALPSNDSDAKAPHDALADSIGTTGSPLDVAAQQAGTQTLLRGLAILEAIASGARDMRAIGAALGTTRSTTHRLVSSLVQSRYLRQVQGGYLLGPKLIELGTVALEQMPLTAVARPHLEALAEATLDTIHLGVRDGDDVLYIDKIPGTRGLEMRSRVGHRMPLASTGIGKAMMLDIEPDVWAQLFEASRRSLSGVNFKPDRRPDAATFLQRMAHYAAGGYTFDLEENEASIRCVAAPVRDASGAIVAAVSVASTIPYMPLERMDELIPIVQREARAISAELGWSAPQTTRRIKR